MIYARVECSSANAKFQENHERRSTDTLKRLLLVLLMGIFGKEMEERSKTPALYRAKKGPEGRYGRNERMEGKQLTPC